MSSMGDSLVLTKNILTRAHDEVTQGDVNLRKKRKKASTLLDYACFPPHPPALLCIVYSNSLRLTS